MAESEEVTRVVAESGELTGVVEKSGEVTRVVEESGEVVRLGETEAEGRGELNEEVSNTVREEVEGRKPSKRSLKRQQKWEQRQQRMREGRREEKKRRDRKKREEGIRGRREVIKLSDDRASKVSVVLDCSFDQLMTRHELYGLAKQIKFCYASNRNSSTPVQLHLCGYSGGVKESLGGSSPEHVKWDIHLHPEEITEVFTPPQMVYLTADSSDVIREVSPDKCYVIGGLLDHNRHKGACFEKAKRLGLANGRLGLENIVKLNSRAVLAVNHVFDILLRYSSSGNWREAILGALPARKIECVKENSDSQSADESAAAKVSEQQQ